MKEVYVRKEIKIRLNGKLTPFPYYVLTRRKAKRGKR